jgi:hypothetical protein
MRKLFLLMLLIGCSGDDETEVERQVPPCAELRDHLIELRMAGISGTPAQRAETRAMMERSLGTEFATSCESKLSTTQVACAIGATTLNAASACAEPTTSAR